MPKINPSPINNTKHRGRYRSKAAPPLSLLDKVFALAQNPENQMLQKSIIEYKPLDHWQEQHVLRSPDDTSTSLSTPWLLLVDVTLNAQEKSRPLLGVLFTVMQSLPKAAWITPRVDQAAMIEFPMHIIMRTCCDALGDSNNTDDALHNVTFAAVATLCRYPELLVLPNCHNDTALRILMYILCSPFGNKIELQPIFDPVLAALNTVKHGLCREDIEPLLALIKQNLASPKKEALAIKLQEFLALEQHGNELNDQGTANRVQEFASSRTSVGGMFASNTTARALVPNKAQETSFEVPGAEYCATGVEFIKLEHNQSYYLIGLFCTTKPNMRGARYYPSTGAFTTWDGTKPLADRSPLRQRGVIAEIINHYLPAEHFHVWEMPAASL